MNKIKFEKLVREVKFQYRHAQLELFGDTNLDCIIQAQRIVIERLVSRVEKLEKIALSQDNNSDTSYQLAFYARENVERAFKGIAKLCQILGIKYEVVHTDIVKNQGFVRVLGIDSMGILEKIIRITKAKKYKLVDIPSKINLVSLQNVTGQEDENE